MLILVISLSQVERMPTNKKYVKKCVMWPPAPAHASTATDCLWKQLKCVKYGT